MLRLLLLAQIFLICEPAFAKPITLVEFRNEFLLREFNSVKIGYIDTHPTMSAAVDGQGFDAVLRECSPIEGTCQAARFTACRELPDYSRSEALELANDMNVGFNRGTAYAKSGTAASSVCVRLQVTFRDDDNFGIRQIYEWQRALEEFTTSVDQDLNARLAADVRALLEQ